MSLNHIDGNLKCDKVDARMAPPRPGDQKCWIIATDIENDVWQSDSSFKKLVWNIDDLSRVQKHKFD